MTRAAFLLLTSLLFSASAADLPARKRMAVITTVWWKPSHAWHMAERFLWGYPEQGRWHKPPLDVVSAYVAQYPKNDLSRGRAKEAGFTIYPTIAETLRCGGDKLAVDAVLLIGEHGEYPKNELGQKLYPRYEFFQEIVEVFREDGRSVPVFNDKHLSWKWEWAKEMVDQSRELNFPFLAGSSLPVTWRMPAVDLPHGAVTEEIVCVAYGGKEIYGFHALETLQCIAERRQSGETGVRSVEALQGDDVWHAMENGAWDPKLFEACLSRSQTLKQVGDFSHRYPTPKQMRQLCQNPILYRLEYRDGLNASMLLLNGLVGDFTIAARIKGQTEPFSTLFYLPPVPNVTYSAALMSNAEKMFLIGKAPYPVERTLLTSGMLESCLKSLATGRQLRTPHLDVRYTTPRESTFVRR
ncbi:MAG: hypothetical protein CMO80_22540 [Verrucomicrobiales bacterium]|nr:hypothetical protein [Verrucomicrobiales bacterium]|tara:strand:+ start:132 stop:1364 length:1233 start_codon:yes stop_codon:yes gene_type:complete